MKLISFSVFGTDRTYSAGAVANARLVRDHYPGWVCRFYIGDSVDAGDRQALIEFEHVEVIDMVGPHDPFDWSGVMWRFLSLNDDDVEVHLFRDADSRPSRRESAAVAEWLDSGRQFHIMRDHPAHWIEILAGMWGCTRDGARRIRPLLPNPLWNTAPYVDQWWLRDRVYPIARTNAMIHDSIGHIEGEQFHPFPAGRDEPWQFVAQGYNADDSLRVPSDALAQRD